MNIAALQEGMQALKSDMESSICRATFDGRHYGNGQKAKEALIRSSRLIMRVHEVVKKSLNEELLRMGYRDFSIHPPIGSSSPELKIVGFIKAKDQDVVVLSHGDRPLAERIEDGPLAGETDTVGRNQSERSIVIGVRSQLSSVAKNFDTLMERAFAETLNLRLRLPRLVMGEVYVLPVVEYDDKQMEENRVVFQTRTTPVEKFIKTFLAISGRVYSNTQSDLYKYERSALVLVDLRPRQPVLFTSTEQLKAGGFLPPSSGLEFEKISPLNFARDIVHAHAERHR